MHDTFFIDIFIDISGRRYWKQEGEGKQEEYPGLLAEAVHVLSPLSFNKNQEQNIDQKKQIFNKVNPIY
ncbi:MAG: hypothetical protein PHO83_16965 [Geobacteraceae bacterium]|nr:hypothetical protein [Geobacteraceae bacterium]